MRKLVRGIAIARSHLSIALLALCLSAPLRGEPTVTVLVRLKPSAGSVAGRSLRLGQGATGGFVRPHGGLLFPKGSDTDGTGFPAASPVLRPKSSLTAGSSPTGPSTLRGMLVQRRRYFYDEHRHVMGMLFDSRLKEPASGDPLRRLVDPVKGLLGRSTPLGTVHDFRALWLVDAVRVRCSKAVADRLRKHEDVAAVELDPFLEVGRAETVEAAGATRPWHGDDTGATALWKAGLRGEGVRVGVIDTGLDGKAPFAAHVEAYRDFTSTPSLHPTDPLGHGTAVASLLVGGDGVGVAPEAKLVVARAVEMLRISPDPAERSRTMGAFASRMIEAMQWMIDPDGDEATDDGPDVINCSWGFPRNVSLDEDIFSEAVDRIRDAGILPVFSAGNARSESANRVNFPGVYPQVLTVGAATREGKRAEFSCVGSDANPRIKPDLMAPGDEIVAIGPGGERVLQRGTSFSAPLVAGGAALLKQARPDLDPESLRAILESSAEDMAAPGKDRETGWGALRLARALEALGEETDRLVREGRPEEILGWIDGGGLRTTGNAGSWATGRHERFDELLLARLQAALDGGEKEAVITSFVDRAIPGNDEGIALRRRLRRKLAFDVAGDPSREGLARAVGASLRVDP